MDDPFSPSRIADSMRPSPIRELFRVIGQPGMISFAGGLPDPGVFPVEQFASCADILATDGRKILQYGPSTGHPPLRETMIEMMTEGLGYPVHPEELLIASGAQQVVNLLARVLIDPGDPVVVEAPTYPGTIHCLRNTGARFVTVPCDESGLQVDQLPDAVARCEAATGRRPKLIYTVPNFSNPTGACLSLQRRQRLVTIAEKLGIPILEDDPYGALRYSGDSLPSLKRLVGGSPLVVYASSFSKILAPGVRVGWVVGSPSVIRSMELMRQGEDLCTATVTQALVDQYCRRGYLEPHLKTIVARYAAKCAAMEAALSEHLRGCAAQWHRPQGGFFYWLRMPGRSARDVFDRAVDRGVAFVPGAAFSPEANECVGHAEVEHESARLCFTFATTAEIEEGCRRLADALA